MKNTYIKGRTQESKMSEFTLDDGRKAEKLENNLDPMTKVTEVYVEPKLQKKLSQRITERFCVCEREIETLDEATGEVVNRIVEKTCDGFESVKKSAVRQAVEEKVSRGFALKDYVLVGLIALQAIVVLYFLISSL
jgi:N-methylhydantoinase A/oxoprolinase/acetone carboxylase beta subunit